MAYVCICNGINETAFREAARRPDVKTHLDVLQACGAAGKQCVAPCSRDGKQIIRQEKELAPRPAA